MYFSGVVVLVAYVYHNSAILKNGFFILLFSECQAPEMESLKLIGLKGLPLPVLCVYYTYIAYTLFFSP